MHKTSRRSKGGRRTPGPRLSLPRPARRNNAIDAWRRSYEALKGRGSSAVAFCLDAGVSTKLPAEV